MRLHSLMILALALAVQACGTYSTSSVTPATGAAQISAVPKAPEQVMVTEKDILDRRYISLGDISITVRKVTIFDKDPSKELVNKALQEDAAEMGADAVVLVRYGTPGMGVFSYSQLEGAGRAVKFQ